MEAFWSYFGAGDDFGALSTVSKRSAKILKNIEKRYKVLQKSRFGGSENYEKNHLGRQVETEFEAKLAYQSASWS